MVSQSPRRRRNVNRGKFTSVGNHEKFLSRIKKSLYYGRLPSTERLSLPVTELATELFSAAQRNHSLQSLDLEEAGSLARSACVSPCSLVLALLYLERLQTCQPTYLQDTSPSELYLVSVMVATKFLQDDGEDDGVVNDEWAASAGISTSYLNQLERKFLSAIDWEVFVNEEAFWTRLRGLERDVALTEGIRRGWFTYADLDVLLEKFDLASVAHTVLSVSAVCLTSYTASVLTLVASTLLVSQLQLVISTFSGISTTSVPTPTALPLDVPASLLDQQMGMNLKDSALPHTHQSAMDVLTTSFILASISSCNDVHSNDSRSGCNDSRRPEDSPIPNSFFGEQNMLNELDGSESLSSVDDIVWDSSNCMGWFSWLKNLERIFGGRGLAQWGSSPDWATSLSHFIEKSSSMGQARLIPIEVH